MNLPNRLTMSRLLFALAIFAILEVILRTQSADPSADGPAFLSIAALVLFIVAALTDAVDGYIARKRNLATAFGRMADPLMDKIIISGILVFLTRIPSTSAAVPAWMVVLVLVREFLMTGMRGFIEGKGQGFGAQILGKAKMTIQCIMVCYAFVHIGFLTAYDGSHLALAVMMWLTLLSTLGSGLSYVPTALTVFRDAKDI